MSENLILESEKMVERKEITPLAQALCSARSCGLCKYFEPHRDPETKRVHPSKQGRCGWEMPEITWPLAYRRVGYGYGREQDPPKPYAAGIWKDTDAKSCACYEPNAEIRHGGPETHD